MMQDTISDEMQRQWADLDALLHDDSMTALLDSARVDLQPLLDAMADESGRLAAGAS